VGEERKEAKGLQGAFSERGSLTRSTSPRTKAADFTALILRSCLLRVGDPRSGFRFALTHF
jgi:hypothetical protein